MRRDQADQREVFFLLSRCYLTCKVKKGEDVDDLCSQNFFHCDGDLCPVLSSTPSPMTVYWLATSVFHFSLAIALG